MSSRRSRFQIKPKVVGLDTKEPANIPSDNPVPPVSQPAVGTEVHNKPEARTETSPKKVEPIPASDIVKGSGRRARFQVKPQIGKAAVERVQSPVATVSNLERPIPIVIEPPLTVPPQVESPSVSQIPSERTIECTTAESSVNLLDTTQTTMQIYSDKQLIVASFAKETSPCVLPACDPIRVSTNNELVESDVANINDLLVSPNEAEDKMSCVCDNSQLITRSGRVSRPRPNMKADQVWKTAPKRSRTESVKSCSSSSSKKMSGLEEIDRSTFTMADLINFNPKNPEAMAGKEDLPRPFKKAKGKKAVRGHYDDPEWKKNLHVKELKVEQDEAKYVAPQLKLSADGTLTVDESSMTVQCETEKKEFERVGDTTARVTSMSFFRKQMKHTKFWTDKETEMFYRLLPATGTDFWLMSEFFPKRSRNELKNKFKRESKRFPHKIKDAMSEPCLLDPRVFDLAPGKGQQKKKVKLEKKLESNENPENEDGNSGTESDGDDSDSGVSRKKKEEMETLKQWEEDAFAGRTREEVKAQFEIPSRYGRQRKLREEAVVSFAALSSGNAQNEESTADSKPDVKRINLTEQLMATADKVVGKSFEPPAKRISEFPKFEPSTVKDRKAISNQSEGLEPSDILPPDVLEEVVEHAKKSKDGHVIVQMSDDTNERLILAVQKSDVPGKPDMVHFYKLTDEKRSVETSEVSPSTSKIVNVDISHEDDLDIIG